jgi:hypothetical protein
MRTLPRFTAAATALLLAAGSAACTAESPTASSTAPAGPRLDSGPGFGSGNVVASGGSTWGAGNVVMGGKNDKAAADSGSTATRGLGFGSGS